MSLRSLRLSSLDALFIRSVSHRSTAARRVASFTTLFGLTLVAPSCGEQTQHDPGTLGTTATTTDPSVSPTGLAPGPSGTPDPSAMPSPPGTPNNPLPEGTGGTPNAPMPGPSGTAGLPSLGDPCPVATQMDCGGACIEVSTDAANCGSCGHTCEGSQSCVGGLCQCPGGGAACASACVDVMSDENHCGACDAPCDTGTTCTAGTCDCRDGLNDCGTGCVDTLSDAAHCGQCDNACPSGQVCSSGSCAADCGVLAQCGQSCVDLQVSNLHCGQCNVACLGDQSCQSGSCSCPGGQVACDGTCVDTNSSSAHCGGCGQACSGGETCTGGSCECPDGQESCEEQCVSTDSNNAHCGSCNNACDGGRSCQGGVCECPDGQEFCNNNTCVDTNTSNDHCGGCGLACNGTAMCTDGLCTGGEPICNDPGLPEHDNNGSITWYTFSQGTAGVGDVHCSFGIQENPDRVGHIPTGGGEHFGAINITEYAGSALCGACVEVRRNNGSSVVITVADSCDPALGNDPCTSGHIDLSRSAYQQLGDPNSEGYLTNGISWSIVPCPVDGNIGYFFENASQEFYLSVTIVNHRNPIGSVEVQLNGSFQQLSRRNDNRWILDTEVGNGPYTFRVTDVYGNVVQDAGIALQPGQRVNGNQQFPECD